MMRPLHGIMALLPLFFCLLLRKEKEGKVRSKDGEREVGQHVQPCTRLWLTAQGIVYGLLQLLDASSVRRIISKLLPIDSSMTVS